jgi:hypothetical protein
MAAPLEPFLASLTEALSVIAATRLEYGKTIVSAPLLGLPVH